MRIILYTGKGGVGKTSIAAASACKIASQNKKVLIVSTDQAHSLGDCFGIKLSNEATKISENLFGMEIDSFEENERSWGNIKDYIEQLMVLKSEESIQTEELLVFPGFEELLSLIKIKELSDKSEFDVIIVDCAPTGETMSLLKFPDLFKWWMDKIFPMKRKGAAIAGPLVEKTMKIPMPSDKVFDEIEGLYNKIDELHKMMLDKDVVSIRLVTTPEKIVVKEAKRSFSYLHLFDYNVDAVIINRIFPKESLHGYFNPWEGIQKQSIMDIEEGFVTIPIFQMELLQTELRSYEVLKKVGDELYKSSNPIDILFRDKIFTIAKNEQGHQLCINMPFVDKSELSLSQNGDELSVAIKNEKRVFTLPNKLQSKEVAGAKYEEGMLKIQFSNNN